MEIFAELFLGLLQFLAEILLQFLVEALVEAGLHAARKPIRFPTVDPWIAAVGYMLLGTGAGFVSVWFFPQSFLASPFARMANVVLTPLCTGGLMALLGAWRRRRGQDVLRIDRFFHGFLFAFAMALVRYFYTNP